MRIENAGFWPAFFVLIRAEPILNYFAELFGRTA